MKYKITIILVMNLLFSSLLKAENTHFQRIDSTNTTKWYVPGYITLNYAGHQGLFAIGSGLDFNKNKMLLEISLGWLPESVGGVNINSIHLKYTYQVFEMKFSKPGGLMFYPLNATVFLNRLRLSSDSRMDKSLYPSHYYYWMNNTRFEFGVGQSWKYYFNESSRALQLYYEFVSNDLYLHSYTQNKKVKVKHIFFFGVGFRYFF